MDVEGDERVEKGRGLVARGRRDAGKQGRVEQPALARLNASVSLAMGQGHNLRTNRIEEQWFEPLAETVRFFARHEHHVDVANRIMQHWLFQRSDECKKIRAEIVDALQANMATLSIRQIRLFFRGIAANDPGVQTDGCHKSAPAL